MREVLKTLRQTHIEPHFSFPRPPVKPSHSFTEVQVNGLKLGEDRREVKSVVYWLPNQHDYCLIADMEKYFIVASTDYVPDKLIIPDERIIYAYGKDYSGYYDYAIDLIGIFPINQFSKDLIVYMKLRGEISFDVIDEFMEVKNAA